MAPSGSANSDLCIALTGTHNFQWQLSALTGASAGFPYKAVSGYITLPHGVYDIAWVTPAGQSCTPTGTSTYPPNTLWEIVDQALGEGEWITAIPFGSVQGLDVGMNLSYDESAPPAGTPAGGATIRFVNATYAVAAPAVFGTGVVGQAGFTALFSGAPGGGGVAPAGSGVDSLGYIQVAPLVNQTFSAGKVGGATPVLTASNTTLPDPSLTSKVITVFMAGDESPAIPSADRVGPSFVQVDDQGTPTNGLLPTH
jgi:hypothetical protein